MANSVWHNGLERVLALDMDDLGLSESSRYAVPDLIDSLLRPLAERDRTLLQCVQSQRGLPCKAEAQGVQSRFMYVRKHRGPDGRLRLRAAHLPTVYAMSSQESDQHKAMKEFVARTCDSAGLEYMVEKATKNRTSRPDVTVMGDGGLDLGCEAQYYNASTNMVLRRSRAHAGAGLTANWITDNDTFHLVDRANWMLTRPATWKQISSASDLPLMGATACSLTGDARRRPSGHALTDWPSRAAAVRISSGTPREGSTTKEQVGPDGLAAVVASPWDRP
ncbi:hypothetical protein ABZ926_14650 [Streptomyces litmocidini]|uniref:competence protein CoiA family protein n=1 Tax=Streptomyces litmocidini TaxID=67318 RepID=UPI0033FFC4C7